ncbi:hypothetical protein CDA63_13605 [Hymenobacter amundsenii]|uniref:Antitoxin VbhA domain-containing protein n=1 Tax=Hymenobacter amundsenii TaxID=2006685 RepID=A0A246FLR9_9BACT|nr:hypothetical protein [Hymenobacter amundsenii]OWP62539.1 hypothetical protein CDA63_13605 [Hymenobacter amundsenii]
MECNSKYGPCAQTPAQRYYVLLRLQDAIPSLRTKATPYAQQLYASYVAGDLSWTEVRHALNVRHCQQAPTG